jgi:hypothetical protein
MVLAKPDLQEKATDAERKHQGSSIDIDRLTRNNRLYNQLVQVTRKMIKFKNWLFYLAFTSQN